MVGVRGASLRCYLPDPPERPGEEVVLRLLVGVGRGLLERG